MSELKHPNLHLLALERTGWRRWIFGRWAYSSEPFRHDIQNQLKGRVHFKIMCPKHMRYYPPQEKE